MIYDKNYLKEVSLTNILFEKICKKADNIDFIYLSFNSSLSLVMINKLFSLNIENVNINLLKNSLCPSCKIIEFLKLNDKIYNIAIAHNKNLEKNIIKELIKLNDKDVNDSLEFMNQY